MNGPLRDFFRSKENQGKYGFEYCPDSSAIIFDGDVDRLMSIAFEATGFKAVGPQDEQEGRRPVLSFTLDNEGYLVNDDNGSRIETGVDGEGVEPNFYLKIRSDNGSIILRLCMTEPKLYPNDESCPYQLAMSSLSAINQFYKKGREELIKRWNTLHPDSVVTTNPIPNYRAINRIS